MRTDNREEYNNCYKNKIRLKKNEVRLGGNRRTIEQEWYNQ